MPDTTPDYFSTTKVQLNIRTEQYFKDRLEEKRLDYCQNNKVNLSMTQYILHLLEEGMDNQ